MKQQIYNPTQKAAAIYSKKFLLIYDFLVLVLSNRWVWRCPSKILLDHYNQHIAARHLDVGVGSGYFLDKCQFSSITPMIHLLDLNPDALEVTAKRIQRYQPKTHCVNILEPLTLQLPTFDSIAINYLLHCLPGTFRTKEIVFNNLIALLNPGGVIFGATLLGKDVKFNWLAKKIADFYNTKGFFNNKEDDLRSLETILDKNFKHYTLKQVGCVAIFNGYI